MYNTNYHNDIDIYDQSYSRPDRSNNQEQFSINDLYLQFTQRARKCEFSNISDGGGGNGYNMIRNFRCLSKKK